MGSGGKAGKRKSEEASQTQSPRPNKRRLGGQVREMRRRITNQEANYTGGRKRGVPAAGYGGHAAAASTHGSDKVKNAAKQISTFGAPNSDLFKKQKAKGSISKNTSG